MADLKRYQDLMAALADMKKPRYQDGTESSVSSPFTLQNPELTADQEDSTNMAENLDYNTGISSENLPEVNPENFITASDLTTGESTPAAFKASSGAQWGDALTNIANMINAQYGKAQVASPGLVKQEMDQYKNQMLMQKYNAAKAGKSEYIDQKTGRLFKKNDKGEWESSTIPGFQPTPLTDKEKADLALIQANIERAKAETDKIKRGNVEEKYIIDPTTKELRKANPGEQGSTLNELKAIKDLSTPKPTMLDKLDAAKFEKTQSSVAGLGNNLSLVDDALNSQINYAKNSILGTGSIATLGGLTAYGSTDTETLKNKFNNINLKNMVTTFSGMSKAVDSDAERRAWNATQPSIANDDKTNLSILYGLKSSLLKDKAVADAQADWYSTHNNSLKGFEQSNPILQGLMTTVVDRQSGEMKLVPKSEVKSLKKQGYTSIDDYVNLVDNSNYDINKVASRIPKNELKNRLNTSSETLRVIAPNGQSGSIPKERLQDYLNNGYKLAE